MEKRSFCRPLFSTLKNWNQEEFDRIVAAADRQPHIDIFLLLGLIGMRIGEVEHLLWEDLDFPNRVIKIQAKTGWKPKSGDARTVPRWMV